LARALVAMKREADLAKSELDDVPRWRARRRSELRATLSELHSQEKRLLNALGGRRAARG
jgi:hypothetical protein